MQKIRWAINFDAWNPTFDDILKCSSFLQCEEKEYVNKFFYKNDAKASICGKLLIRKACKELLKVSYNELCFSRTPYGKPILDSPNLKGLDFNISHQGSFCAIAAQIGSIIGIDVMNFSATKTISQIKNIMKKNFGKNEVEFILNQKTEQQKLNSFFRIWALKESYLKATGKGIVDGLANITFIVSSSSLDKSSFLTDTQVMVKDCIKDDWGFEEQLLDSDHCVAVALCPKLLNNSKCFEVLSYDDLVNDAISFNTFDYLFAKSFIEKELRFKHRIVNR